MAPHIKTKQNRLKLSFFARFIAKIIAHTLLFLINGIKPLLGPSHCKYPISCSEFAEIELKNKPLFTAIWNITKRVLSCNPFVNPR